MKNFIFLDDENIPLVTRHEEDCEGNHDSDYDNCNTPNTSTLHETTFKKLKKVEENPTYSVEQRQLYRDRLSDLNTENKQSSKYNHKIKKIKRSSNTGCKDQADY